jgi:glucose/arabinose dehydrogenase
MGSLARYVFKIAALSAFCMVGASAQDAMPTVAAGFTIERIAVVDGARELVATPNGDLFIGTAGDTVALLPHADADHPDAPHTFATFNNHPAAGVTLGDDSLVVGTQFAVYEIPYRTGDQKPRGAPVKLLDVRLSGTARDHVTTSVAVEGDYLFASVGSSCNACVPELDSTRATIQRFDLLRHVSTDEAYNIRNAIALTINPATKTLWAGIAGADDLPLYHPYEIFDAVSLHDNPVDYGWPACYENRKHFEKWPGDCSKTPIPRVIFPAYETPIGAVFYPTDAHGAHAFPAMYRGGAFVTLHGSWHGPQQGLSGYMPPLVVFVPMKGDTPEHPANWSDPTTQWKKFIDGYQSGGTSDRIGRPTGIAVGPDGSLFVADDQTGAIYRIRPRQIAGHGTALPSGVPLGAGAL